MGKIIKDDHVEILELLQENVVDGKGDQTQLILRHVHTVSRGSEKDKGDKLYQGVLFHRHAQKSIIPSRRAGQGEHADLVALYIDLKILLIVLGNLLVRLVWNGKRKTVGADFLRREAEGNFLLEGISIDADGTAGDQVLTAIKIQRECFALETIGLNRQIEFQLPSTEGEIGRASCRERV